MIEKHAFVSGLLFSLFALTANAQTITVQGMKHCEPAQMESGMKQKMPNISVPVGVKRTITSGQAVAVISTDDGEIQINREIRTEMDHKSFLGVSKSQPLIWRGDSCVSAIFPSDSDKYLRLDCVSPEHPSLHNVYYTTTSGQFCDMFFHVNQFSGALELNVISSVAPSESAISFYRSTLKTVIVFQASDDGSLYFESRVVGPGGAILSTQPYTFDATTTVAGDPVGVGPVAIKVLDLHGSSLTYEVLPAQPGV
ncbi:hypothetical protein SBC1_81090 (plasmid) [Caballeronia sp. SBC1]|uniref:hypothetical protein n=1 Tax=Caballeronia sp. SBC1 TaxID=2705548 RepID=UPI0014090087|nr:hypothetical protein [Caballeronia sp. SBC1]QIN68062.1 hypothetical protein SBC1_81090 [Caballeronia sp. SBC1]